MCWIGSLGEGHLRSHSGRVIVDCSHMVTYDPTRPNRSLHCFKWLLVLAFGLTQSFIERTSDPVHRYFRGSRNMNFFLEENLCQAAYFSQKEY